MLHRPLVPLAGVFLAVVAGAGAHGETVVEHPFLGVTHISRTESAGSGLPRNVRMHIVRIDLTAPFIGFKLTPRCSPPCTRETIRQTTLAFLNQEGAQIAINSHFFVPFPSADLNADLVGFAASSGSMPPAYSAFEAPAQRYALLKDAPAINIDPGNEASIVRRDPASAGGLRVAGEAIVWNAFAGSAQIITNGVKTIPCYVEAARPECQLAGPGNGNYSNGKSWYDVVTARTVIGLSRDNRTLFFFLVDKAGGSEGMRAGEVADLLIADYGVYNALNMDGGGSTALAMQDPVTRAGRLVNVPSDKADGSPPGRSVASSLAVFAGRRPSEARPERLPRRNVSPRQAKKAIRIYTRTTTSTIRVGKQDHGYP